MKLSAIFLSIFIHQIQCDNKLNNKLDSTNKLTLLGIIHGYKINRNSAVKYPGILVSPIIVIPTLDHEQNVDFQINNDKVLTPTNSTFDDETQLEDSNDIEVNFREALDRGSESKKDLRQIKTKENLKKSVEKKKDKNKKKKPTNSEDTTLNPTTEESEENFTYETTTELLTTTETDPVYPNAVYNNQDVSAVTITIKGPDEILYPPSTDEHWKYFSISTNVSLKENTTKEEPSGTGYPSVNNNDSPIKGVYPSALYNNAEIDQLSITTNSYTNRSPQPVPQDDRWTSFGSLRKNSPTSNEFRPLAGLYYDGFLHSPILKTQGFVPYNHYPLRYLS